MDGMSRLRRQVEELISLLPERILRLLDVLPSHLDIPHVAGIPVHLTLWDTIVVGLDIWIIGYYHIRQIWCRLRSFSVNDEVLAIFYYLILVIIRLQTACGRVEWYIIVNLLIERHPRIRPIEHKCGARLTIFARHNVFVCVAVCRRAGI